MPYLKCASIHKTANVFSVISGIFSVISSILSVISHAVLTRVLQILLDCHLEYSLH